VVTVSEDEIAAAILALIEKQKLIAEGAGAVSVAAAMFGRLPIEGRKTVCVVSGGNIDVNILSRVITRGLVMGGRNSVLQIALEDKPGQLVGVSRIISDCGGNVVSVHHERSDANMAISSCFLKIGMDARLRPDRAHQIRADEGRLPHRIRPRAGDVISPDNKRTSSRRKRSFAVFRHFRPARR